MDFLFDLKKKSSMSVYYYHCISLNAFDIALIFFDFFKLILVITMLAELPCEGWLKYIDLTPEHIGPSPTMSSMPDNVLGATTAQKQTKQQTRNTPPPPNFVKNYLSS